MTRVFFAPLLLLFARTPRLSLLANLFSLFLQFVYPTLLFWLQTQSFISAPAPGLLSPRRSHRSLGTQAGTLRAHVLWRNYSA